MQKRVMAWVVFAALAATLAGMPSLAVADEATEGATANPAAKPAVSVTASADASNAAFEAQQYPNADGVQANAAGGQEAPEQETAAQTEATDASGAYAGEQADLDSNTAPADVFASGEPVGGLSQAGAVAEGALDGEACAPESDGRASSALDDAPAAEGQEPDAGVDVGLGHSAEEPSPMQPQALQLATAEGDTRAVSAGVAWVNLRGLLATTSWDGDPDDVLTYAGSELDGRIVRIETATNRSNAITFASVSEGANSQVGKKADSLDYFYRMSWMGDGSFGLHGLGNNKALTVQGQRAGSNVSWAAWTGASSQRFKLAQEADGSYLIVPLQDSTLRLDVADASTRAGANIQVYTANSSAAQRFFLVANDLLARAASLGKTVQEGFVSLVSALDGQSCMDVEGGSVEQGANVQLYTPNGTAAQKWQLEYLENGLYSIRSAVSGKYLAAARASASAGANVQQAVYSRSLDHLWFIEEGPQGYTIKSAASGMAVDIAGGKAARSANIQLAAPGATSQNFTFKAVQLIDNATYVIQSAVIAPMVLDVENGSGANGANVRIWRSNGTKAQQFAIEHVGGGYYTIRNLASGKYLAVSGGSSAAGANVVQNDGQGNAQKWRAEIGPDGGIVFRSAASGKVLDVADGTRKSGTNVRQWTDSGAAAQTFYLKAQDWSFYDGASFDAMRYIQKAEEYEGWRYRWGGRSPQTSFDCAGLVMWCANQVWGTNFDLMYTNASRLYNMCEHITADQARPGDLVFYKGTYNSLDYISHVVIYCGNGVMYGAGDPIGYDYVSDITNMAGKQATALYARIRR